MYVVGATFYFFFIYVVSLPGHCGYFFLSFAKTGKRVRAAVRETLPQHMRLSQDFVISQLAFVCKIINDRSKKKKKSFYRQVHLTHARNN